MGIKNHSGKALWLMAVGTLLFGGPTAKGDFVFGEPEPVANLNSESADIAPSITADGLELYFTSNRDHGADLSYCDIWVATRTSTDEPWETPRNLGAPVNRPEGAEASPCISADGLELYFSDVWPGSIPESALRPGGYGGGDIWVSKRETREAQWGIPTNLGPVVNSIDEYDGTPYVSTDGLSLYFSSNRAPGNGGDFYVCTRPTKDDPWEQPTALGAPINTMAEQDYLFHPFLSCDGLSMIFTSVPWPWSGSEVASNGDIFLCTRSHGEDSWGVPSRLTVLSSDSYDSGGAFACGGSVLYFSRGDPLNPSPHVVFDPARGTADIWKVEVTPLVDFDGDGIPTLIDLTMLIENWGSDNTVFDIGPMPLGDGRVDVEDLKVFIASWEKDNPEEARLTISKPSRR